jgi:hypothetical protein
VPRRGQPTAGGLARSCCGPLKRSPRSPRLTCAAPVRLRRHFRRYPARCRSHPKIRLQPETAALFGVDTTTPPVPPPPRQPAQPITSTEGWQSCSNQPHPGTWCPPDSSRIAPPSSASAGGAPRCGSRTETAPSAARTIFPRFSPNSFSLAAPHQILHPKPCPRSPDTKFIASLSLSQRHRRTP